MTRRPAGDAVVTGIGVVCPGARVAADLGPGRPGRAEADGWFDARSELGRGHKYLPPAGQYLLAASRRALADAAAWSRGLCEEALGAAVGTNSAASALHDTMDRTVIQGHADELSPATAPFFSINLFSSSLSTQHGLKGFNLTVTTPRIAGLEAAEVGLRALRLGRCSALLAGATEAPATPAEAPAAYPEAGSAVLLFEGREAALARGATIYGSCRVRTCFLPPRLLATADGRRMAGEVLGRALAQLGCRPEPLRVHLELDASLVGATVLGCLARLGYGTEGAGAAEPGAGCLEPVLRLTHLLAVADEQLVSVTAAASGHVALAWLCPWPQPSATDVPPPAVVVGAGSSEERC